MIRYHKAKPYLIIVIAAMLFLLPQLVSKNMIIGSDSLFHFNRFYDIAKQIETGDHSYFISLYGFQQSGRIVNAFYGPFFAYFHGLLVYLSPSWFHYQLLANFSLYLLAGFSMYILLRFYAVSQKNSCLLAFFYLTTFAVQYWITRQGFSSWGAAVFPLGLLPLKFFSVEKKFPVRLIAFFMALIFQIHLLTSVFLAITYFIFFVPLFLKHQRKGRLIWQLLISILIFLGLTTNVWYNMLILYQQNNILPPFINYAMYKNTVNWESAYCLVTPLPLLWMIISTFRVSWKKWQYLSSWEKSLCAALLFFFILSTNLFPWKYLIDQQHKIAQRIQFPFRLFLPFTALFILWFGQLSKQTFSAKKDWLEYAVIISIMQTWGLSSYSLYTWQTQPLINEDNIHTFIRMSDQKVKESFFSADLSNALKNMEKSTPDYLPLYGTSEVNKYQLYEKYILGQPKHFKKEVYQQQLTVRWFASKSGWTDVPVIKYTNTMVTLNSKQVSPSMLKFSPIGTIKVYQQKGSNQLTLRYQKPPLFYLSLIFPFICLISVGVIHTSKKMRADTTDDSFLKIFVHLFK